jgi:hypothetical protein
VFTQQSCNSILIFFKYYRLFDEDRNTNQSLQLKDNFNHPETIEEPENLDSLVRGLAIQRSKKRDLIYDNDVSTSLC